MFVSLPIHRTAGLTHVHSWYWWADVPVRFHPNIYALDKEYISKEPSIRYRGIFINDEAPALTGWVRANFGGYSVSFYKKVFELLLRLKANFLWPAMWPGWPNPGASFFTDDPENQETADDWGIVISTSHHEPMQRSSNEWLAENPLGTWDWLANKEKITTFFAQGVRRAKKYESYFTMGMRGEYDTKMRSDDPVAVVKDVLKTQRALIKDVHGREDAIPQFLALYKEVQKQYESGRLDVPDDVTLLFSDDNFGTIRRLPCGKETERCGGAGLYYHLEYVGAPRSYKWINSNCLRKTLHQLREAYRRQARQIWVFNVGDIKPLEIPLTMVMALAWDISCVRNDVLGLQLFFDDVARGMFDRKLAQHVAAVWLEYDNLVSLRRHEHIGPTTFSLLHYNEADHILSRWEDLLAKANRCHDDANEALKPAMFQLVWHPVKASMVFISLQINLGRNQLFARQRRNSTNQYANMVAQLFSLDYDLTKQYHSLLNGKWNHILSQPHLGFVDSTWHAPSRDMISGICLVQEMQDSNPIVGQLGVAVEGHAGIRPGLTNENSDFTHPSRGDLVPGLLLGLMTRYGPRQRFFELFSRGTSVVQWSVEAPYDWLRLSCEQGVLRPATPDRRIYIQIEWNQVPEDFEEEILIDIRSKEGDFEQVHLPVTGRLAPLSSKGPVEADGIIAIHGEKDLRQWDGADPVLGTCFQYNLPDMKMPSTKLSRPHMQLDCDFFAFSDTSKPDSRARLLLYFNMTLDVDPADPMSYDLCFDGGLTTRHRLLEEEESDDAELPSPRGWLKAVQDCVWIKEHALKGFKLGSGQHKLNLRLWHTNMILEKIIVDFGGLNGGLKESYRGPSPWDYHMAWKTPTNE